MKSGAIVLAAGKGTRMKSALAKVLHPVFHKPMVGHVIETLRSMELEQTIAVVGHQRQAVAGYLASYQVDFVEQKEQLGTGHAVLVCQNHVAAGLDTILILCGDTPLLSAQTLQGLLDQHEEQQASLSLLTTRVENPTNYGRIVSDQQGGVARIVEEKDASAEIRAINEINAGVYCVNRAFLFQALSQVGTDNAQGEVYLTDIVGMAVDQGLTVGRFICANPDEVLGVNSRYELSRAADIMQDDFLRSLNDQGVAIQRPGSVAIHPDTKICADTSVESGVTIEANVTVGCRCQIGANSYLQGCHVGDDVHIGPGSLLINVVIENGEQLEPGSKRLA